MEEISPVCGVCIHQYGLQNNGLTVKIIYPKKVHLQEKIKQISIQTQKSIRKENKKGV